MKRERPKETDIGAAMKAEFESKGWTVYPEVWFRGACADLVAVKGGNTWAVECKVDHSFGVIGQAINWMRHADFVSVATTYAARNTYEARHLVMSTLGIGWFEYQNAPGIWNHATKRYDAYRVAEQVPPHRNECDEPGRLLESLCPEQLHSGITPGAQFAPRVTEFSMTCKRLAEYVTANPRCRLREAITGIQHHYATAASARSALRHWITQGKVVGVKAEWEHSRLLLVPDLGGMDDEQGSEWGDG